MSEDPHNLDDTEAELPAPLSADERMRAMELAQATELILSLSRDIAQIARLQDIGRGQLDEVMHQVTYLRQLMDYSLFVTPDQIAPDGELYPVLAWLRDQLAFLIHAVSENAGNGAAAASDSNANVHEALFELEERLRTSMESQSVRLIDSLRYQAAAEEIQRQQTGILTAVLERVSEERHAPEPAGVADHVLSGIQESLFGLEGRLRGTLETQNVRQIDSISYLKTAEALQQQQLALLQFVLERIAARNADPEPAVLSESALDAVREIVHTAENGLRDSLDSQGAQLKESVRCLETAEALQQQQLALLQSVLERVSAPSAEPEPAVLSENALTAVREIVHGAERGLSGSLDLQSVQLNESARCLTKVEELQHQQVELLQSVLHQVSQEKPIPELKLPENALADVCEAVAQAEGRLRGALDAQDSKAAESARYLVTAEELQQQQLSLLQAVFQRVTEEAPETQPGISPEETIDRIRQVVLELEGRLHETLDSQGAQLRDGGRFLATAEGLQQKTLTLLTAVHEHVLQEKPPAELTTLPKEPFDRVSGVVLQVEERLRGSLESQSVRLVDSIRFLAAAEELQQQQLAILRSVLERVSEEKPRDDPTATAQLMLNRLREALGELEGRLRGSFESQSVRLIDTIRYLAAAEEMHQQQWTVLQTVAEKMSEAQPPGINDEALGAIQQAVVQAEERLRASLESHGVRLVESIRYLTTAEELQQQQLSMLQAVFQRVTEETQVPEAAPLLLDESAFDRIRGELFELERRMREGADAQDARQIEGIRFLVHAEEMQHQLFALLQAVLQRVSEEKPEANPNAEYDQQRAAEEREYLDERLSALQAEITYPLESLNLRMIDAFRVLAVMEDEQRSRIDNEDGMLDSLARVLSGGIDSISQNIKGLFETINIRLVDQTRYLATSEAKQREQLVAIRKLLEERAGKPTFAGLRNSLGGGEAGAAQQPEVISLLHSLRGSLEAVQGQLSEHTRQLATHDAQQQSQLNAVRGFLGSTQGQYAPQQLIPDAGVAGGLELIHLQLVDTMRFLAKIEEQQRQALLLAKSAPAAAPDLSEAQSESNEELLDNLAAVLEENTARWGVQQHVFYGLVILLLLVNMGLLCWLNFTH